MSLWMGKERDALLRCQCEEPLIKCNDRGCRCTKCGLLEDTQRAQREYDTVALPHWMSRSYPYLSIAQHFHVSYEHVLAGRPLPAQGNAPSEVRDYADALAAAQRLHGYVQRVGITHAHNVLGAATEQIK